VAAAANAENKRRDFAALLGVLASAPLNLSPRFKSEDDLWDKP
jgi:hypothetical protein